MPTRLVLGFAVSMVTVAVLLGIVLPAVGWFWTVVLILTYSVNAWCLNNPSLYGPPPAREQG